jgi:hypothetical protein
MKVGYPDQMGTPQFKVEITDYSVSVDEWRRAHSAPKGELPELNELQREVAGRFGISEEKYARSVLAIQYAVRRLRTRARKLGEEVEKILLETCAECRVTRVVADLARERWIIVLQAPNRQVGITVSQETGDDFLDFATREATEELRTKVRSGLGAGEQGVSPQ